MAFLFLAKHSPDSSHDHDAEKENNSWKRNVERIWIWMTDFNKTKEYKEDGWDCKNSDVDVPKE